MNKSNLSQGSDIATNHVFVFLEIFALAGGIQSYVKDIFQAYLELLQEQPPDSFSDTHKAEVFLLRDQPGCHNPFESNLIKFHYLKTLPPWKGRLKLAFYLLNCLVKHHPHHVYCGHIKLAPLIRNLCQPLGIPYTILTYGKEVWKPLPQQQKKALKQATSIWTISRYSRDLACQANDIDPHKVQLLPCIVDGNIFTPGAKPLSLVEKYKLANTKVLMTVARLWAGDIYKGWM